MKRSVLVAVVVASALSFCASSVFAKSISTIDTPDLLQDSLSVGGELKNDCRMYSYDNITKVCVCLLTDVFGQSRKKTHPRKNKMDDCFFICRRDCKPYY